MGNPGSYKNVLTEGHKFKSDNFFKLDLKLLRIVSNYCLKKNITLTIFPKFTGKRGEREIKFFKNNFADKKIKYFKKNDSSAKNTKNQIYELADKNLLTLTTHSSFALENLARLNKTAIFNNKIKSSKNIMNILWNYNLPKKGFFWTNDSFDEKEVNRMLNNLSKMKNTLWKKKVKGIAKTLMIYDDQNESIIKLIKKFLRSNN